MREQGTYREIDVLPELEHLAGLPQNQRFSLLQCMGAYSGGYLITVRLSWQYAGPCFARCTKGFRVSAGLIKKVSPVIMGTKLKAPLWQKLF